MHIYMEVARRIGLLNHRGEVGPDDDPQGFKQLFERRGYHVFIVTDEKHNDIASRYNNGRGVPMDEFELNKFEPKEN